MFTTPIQMKKNRPGVLLSVLKNGGASTLDIVANLRAMLPVAMQSMAADIKVTPLFDQSVFVKAAIKGVVAEAVIAAGLTATMVLLFLGNWRSTVIIAATIPRAGTADHPGPRRPGAASIGRWRPDLRQGPGRCRATYAAAWVRRARPGLPRMFET